MFGREKDPVKRALRGAPDNYRQVALSVPDDAPLEQRVRHALFVVGNWSMENPGPRANAVRGRLAALVR